MTCAGQAPTSTPTHSHNQSFPAPCGTLGFAALPFGAQPAPALQPLHIPSWGSPSTHDFLPQRLQGVSPGTTSSPHLHPG